ncbi:MAG: hypothetical protein NC218_09945 [Acetobacter sp.]|nr:hypothetical protein [Acetobacter sp.]
MKQDEHSDLIKQAKRAVRWRFWLHCRIPYKYHCMMVRLECCSLWMLRSYFRDEHLCTEAEVLLVERFVHTNPDLIASYINRHTISNEMELKLVESKSTPLWLHINQTANSLLHPFSLNRPAQLALVKLNDVAYFAQVYKVYPKLCAEAISEIIRLENVQIFEQLFVLSKQENVNISYSHELMLIDQNNIEMLDCFLRHKKQFSENSLHLIIERENTKLMDKLIQKRKFTESVEKFLAQKGSKKMIAQYIKEWPLCPAAQIELVKRDYKDLLKLHFLRHSVSEQTLLYLVNLTQFKAYLGI